MDRSSSAPSDAIETQTPATAPYEVLQQRDDRLVVSLPNRMIVIAQQLRTAPVVSAQIWVKTGSIYEQQHVGAGLSHYLEHLLSGGSTSTRTEQESNAILGDIGARVNAATGLDAVRYYINTTAEHAPAAIDLLSDWLAHSLIGETEFEREGQVIQREFEMGQGDPSRIFWKLTQQARYQVHPARHPTIGYLDEFLRITRDEIIDFYHRMYVPNNMVFVVVGDVDPQQMVDLVAQHWDAIPASPLPKLSLPDEPAITGPRQVTGRADVRAPRLRLAWPGTQLAEPGDYALDLLAVILGQSESSRLVRVVRDEHRAANTISAYNLSFAWGKGFFGIDAEPAAPGADGGPTCEELILAEVDRLRNEPVTEQELARAKRQILAEVVTSAQSAYNLADRLASDTIHMGDPDYLWRYVKAIQSLTAADLQEAARKYLSPDRQITVTLLPTDDEHPVAAQKRDEAADHEKFAEVDVDLDNARLVHTLEGLSASDERSQPVVLDPIREYTLANGLRVLAQRCTLVPGVSMQFYHLGGLLADKPGDEGLANATAGMLDRGTTMHTAEQLNETIDDLGAQLGTAAGNNTYYAQASCLSEDWQTVMALFAEVISKPSFPENEWEKYQQRLLAAIDRQTDTWYGELNTQFRQQYFGDHVWSQPTVGRRDAVAKLTAEDLRQFYAQHVSGSEAVLAVFGDIDPDAVVQEAQRVFAGLPSDAAADFEPVAAGDPVATIVVHKSAKPLAAVQIGFGPGVTFSDDDYPALRVLATVASSFPAGRLEQALRGEGAGLAYAVDASEVAGYVPGYFAVVFNTQPDTVVEATAAAAAVVEQLRDQPVTPEELIRAKASVLTGEFLSRQSNGDRAARTALDVLYKVGLDAPEKFMQDVKALTVDDVQEAARKYLRNPVVVVISHDPVDEQALQAAMAPLQETAP